MSEDPISTVATAIFDGLHSTNDDYRDKDDLQGNVADGLFAIAEAINRFTSMFRDVMVDGIKHHADAVRDAGMPADPTS